MDSFIIFAWFEFYLFMFDKYILVLFIVVISFHVGV